MAAPAGCQPGSGIHTKPCAGLAQPPNNTRTTPSGIQSRMGADPKLMVETYLTFRRRAHGIPVPGRSSVEADLNTGLVCFAPGLTGKTG